MVFWGKGLQQHNEGALFVALIYWEKSKWEVTVPTLNVNTSFFKQLLQERVLPLRIFCMTSKKREKWFEHVQHCNEVEEKHIPNADRVCSQQSHLPEIWQPILKGDKPASFFFSLLCSAFGQNTHVERDTRMVWKRCHITTPLGLKGNPAGSSKPEFYGLMLPWERGYVMSLMDTDVLPHGFSFFRIHFFVF